MDLEPIPHLQVVSPTHTNEFMQTNTFELTPLQNDMNSASLVDTNSPSIPIIDPSPPLITQRPPRQITKLAWMQDYVCLIPIKPFDSCFHKTWKLACMQYQLGGTNIIQ